MIPLDTLTIYIWTIDNPEFAEHIHDIYQRELQLNKANTSDKYTSFLDLNIKVIGSDIHISVYDKCDDIIFPIVNFPGWVVMYLDSHHTAYGIYISQLIRFARYCTSVFDFHFKNLQITSKLLTHGYRYHTVRTDFGKFFRSYSEVLFQYRFKNMYLKESLTWLSQPILFVFIVVSTKDLEIAETRK